MNSRTIDAPRDGGRCAIRRRWCRPCVISVPQEGLVIALDKPGRRWASYWPPPSAP